MSEANLSAALDHYRDIAPRYDRATRLINRIRLEAIGELGLKPGDTVLDAGCGTGWCFEPLLAAIGQEGRLLAFEPSDSMLALASARIEQHGWKNVELFGAVGETAQLPGAPRAVLFSYTHDLIRSRTALDNLFAQVQPDARVAATSTKLYAPWLAPLNWWLRYSHRGYITNFEGFAEPWSTLRTYLDNFSLKTSGLSQHYVASGRLREGVSQMTGRQSRTT